MRTVNLSKILFNKTYLVLILQHRDTKWKKEFGKKESFPQMIPNQQTLNPKNEYTLWWLCMVTVTILLGNYTHWLSDIF